MQAFMPQGARDGHAARPYGALFDRATIHAHRAPDPAPVDAPLPDDHPHHHPDPAHPVPQDDPVPDHKPS